MSIKKLKSIQIAEFTNSSNIEMVKFYKKTDTCKVYFTNGKVYRYSEVTQEEFDNIIKAESVGKAVNSILIQTRKPCEKII